MLQHDNKRYDDKGRTGYFYDQDSESFSKLSPEGQAQAVNALLSYEFPRLNNEYWKNHFLAVSRNEQNANKPMSALRKLLRIMGQNTKPKNDSDNARAAEAAREAVCVHYTRTASDNARRAANEAKDIEDRRAAEAAKAAAAEAAEISAAKAAEAAKISAAKAAEAWGAANTKAAEANKAAKVAAEAEAAKVAAEAEAAEATRAAACAKDAADARAAAYVNAAQFAAIAFIKDINTNDAEAMKTSAQGVIVAASNLTIDIDTSLRAGAANAAKAARAAAKAVEAAKVAAAKTDEAAKVAAEAKAAAEAAAMAAEAKKADEAAKVAAVNYATGLANYSARKGANMIEAAIKTAEATKVAAARLAKARDAAYASTALSSSNSLINPEIKAMSVDNADAVALKYCSSQSIVAQTEFEKKSEGAAFSR